MFVDGVSCQSDVRVSRFTACRLVTGFCSQTDVAPFASLLPERLPCLFTRPFCKRKLFISLEDYTPVNGTRSNLKLIKVSTDAAGCTTTCNQEGGNLVSTYDAAVLNATSLLWKNQGGGKEFYVGGVSTSSNKNWAYPDGEFSSIVFGICATEPHLAMLSRLVASASP